MTATPVTWDALRTDGAHEWVTGSSLYYDLYYLHSVDVWNVENVYVTLSVNPTVIAENGGSATITATLRDRATSEPTTVAHPTNVSIDFCGGVPPSVGDTESCGTTATLVAPPSTGDFTQTGGTPVYVWGNYQRDVYRITIPANESTATLTLTSVDDSEVEGVRDEIIFFRIYEVDRGAWENPAQPLWVRIDEDDRKVTLGVNPLTIADENGGTTTVTATITPVNPNERVDVSLGFTGTATSADYGTSVADNEIRISPGASTGSLTITSLADCIDENDETIVVDIASVTNASEDGTQQATVTMTNVYPRLQSFTIDNASIAENGGTATITATLSSNACQETRINFSFVGSTASAADYLTMGYITIYELTTGTTTVQATQDAVDEEDETIVIGVASVTGADQNGTHEVTTTIVDDDSPPTVTLGISGSPLAENGGGATVTATLSAVSGHTVTVNLGFSGSAGEGDYTRSAGSIVIAAGSLSGSITLTGVDDTVDEADETILVDITGVTNGTENDSQQVTATITDDDEAPTVTLAIDSGDIVENGGLATVTATLSAASEQQVAVELGFTGTAGDGDYTRSADSIVISAGSLTGTITLTATDDALDEIPETVFIDITGVTNGTENGAQQVIATISDDDPTPSVSVSMNPTTIAEAAGVATLTGTLTAPSSMPVTVLLSLSGTATRPADYTTNPSPAQIVIPAGETQGTATFTAVQDTEMETDETIVISVDGAANAELTGTRTFTATILDDDHPPTVTLAVSPATFGEAGGGATVTATLNHVWALDVTVNLSFGGSATNGADYSRSAESITIPAGSPTGTITLTGIDDALDEANETVVVDVTVVVNGTESGTQRATATILDDDAPPEVTLSLQGSPMPETGGSATVTATLSAVSGLPVTVTLTFGGTAAYPGDYTRSGSISIPPGSLTGAITLSATGDSSDEPDETVIVDISGVTNGTETAAQQVTATIADDDVPQVSLGIAGSPMAENSTGIATVTATLDRTAWRDVTVTLAFAGTASGGTDYTSSGTLITIPADSLTGTVTLTAIADTIDEPNETIIVDITGVQNASESGTQQVTATITDDDDPQVLLGITGSTMAENSTGIATVTATLDRTAWQGVTVNLAFSGTATAGTDYSSSGAAITIPAGNVTGTATLTAIADTEDEPDETVIVDISGVTNGIESGTQQVTATITDDDVPQVSLSISGSPVTEDGPGTATVTATLDRTAWQNVTVNLGFGGTATAATDYISSGAAINITAGSLTGSVTLTPVADTIDEPDETVIVDITSVTNASESETQQVTATVSDDDPPPAVTLAVENSPFVENGGLATVRATLDRHSVFPVTVSLAFGGTAVNATDYTRSGMSIVISPLALNGTITLTGIDDTSDEPQETVIVDISSVTNGTENGTQQITATITDDDEPQVSLGIAGTPMAENGTGVATVTATLDRTSWHDVIVNLAFGGTATGGTDYGNSATAITIPAGSVTGTATLTAIADAVDEPDETIVVDITSVTNGTESGTQQVTATITDDDEPQVSLGITGSPMAENGTGVATVTATLDRTSWQSVTVNLAFTGTATLETDYSRSAAAITIPAGNLTGTATLTAMADTADEPDETALVDISSVTNGTESGTQQVTATIIDDDEPQVSLAISGSPMAENSTGIATETATLDRVAWQSVTVNLAFSGTATATTDYSSSAAAITIPAGSLTGTATLTAIADTADEPNETIVVDIGTVTNGAESGLQQVTATITDDDEPQVSLGIAGSPMSESGTGIATLTATLDRTSWQSVTVNLAFSGTATNASDYTRSLESITIAAGSLTGTVTLTGVTDALDEPDETVLVDIASVVNGTESGTQQVTATITDDDEPRVSLGIAGSPMAENGTGIATVTATLDRTAWQDVTVNLAFSGMASGGADYSSSAAAITIPAGSLTGTAILMAIADTIDEPDETIIVDISGVTHGIENGTQQVTGTITDDDTSLVTLGLDGSPFAEAGGIATVTATMSTPSAIDVTVHLDLGGTAGASDYTASAMAITIHAGETTGSITLTGEDDLVYESDETVTVNIGSVDGATEDTSSGEQQVTATITDDEAMPSVTLGLTGTPMAETGGTATVTASLSGPSAFTTTVSLGLSGTATYSADYGTTPPAPVSLAIPPGALEGSLTITAAADALDEADETVIVDVTGVANGIESGTQQVTATITDDDAAPVVTLELTGSPLLEAGGRATVRALLSAPSGRPVTVTFGLSGTATRSSDYTVIPPPLALDIAPGETAGTLKLTAVQDAIDELDETIVVDITGTTNATENGTQQVTATIADDDGPPSVTLHLTGSPIAEAGGVATVTAVLSGASTVPVTVTLAFSGTAVRPADYTSGSTTLEFAPGATEATLTLTAAGDAIDELDESVIIDIVATANAVESGTQQVTATIVDDDAPPSVTLALEGSPIAEAAGVAIVRVILSGPSGLPVTVTLGFSGTATRPGDYTASATTIEIPPGATEGSIELHAVADALDEGNETAIIEITGASNAIESGTQQVIAAIADDDPPPSVSLAVEGSPIAESAGSGTVKAVLNAPSALAVIVTLGLSGTAAYGEDYQTTPAADSGVVHLEITPGELEAALTIIAISDTVDEADETVIAGITAVENGAESGTQEVTATIADDDGPPLVTLSIAGSPIAETGGVATVRAVLGAPSAQPVIVSLSLSGTATSPADYTTTPPAPFALTIPPGATDATLTITTAADALHELDETVVVDIAAVTNGIESGEQQVTATIADDDALPAVTLSLSGSPLAEAGGVATVRALLSTASGLPVTVTLGVTGTATWPDDFVAAPALPAALVIPGGATEASLTLTAVADSIDEVDETVIVDVMAVDGGNEDISAGEQRVTATIADDDTATVTLAVTGIPLAEAGGIAAVTATLSQVSSLPVTVDLAFGGAAAATDYTATAAAIAIAAGSISGSITLTAVDDAAPELDETIVVDVAGVTNALENGVQQVTATITDDDPARLAFATQPSTTVAGRVIAPAVTVQVLDSSGRTAAASTAAVTLALGTNPSAGILTGTLTAAAVGGVATFADLSIDAYGAGYTLVASSAGLAGAVSDPFEITPDVVTTYTGPSPTGTGTIYFSFSGGGAACTLDEVSPLAWPPGADPPPGLAFPHGLVGFELSACEPGAEVSFTIIYPQSLPPGTRYWKYGPPAAGAPPIWYELPAIISGNTVTFTIVDGGAGDADGLANGILRDPGGPAVGQLSAIPTQSEWALLLIALMLASLGLLRIRS